MELVFIVIIKKNRGLGLMASIFSQKHQKKGRAENISKKLKKQKTYRDDYVKSVKKTYKHIQNINTQKKIKTSC